ncbi:4Fe-4S dicluster domain-containing protein [Cellulosilyticum sp. I15G10I2]|uniref:4Fe-4S dicluster domain-containing protein n=1 Tax=Cellulosilyticum sp. I15G10I2 TaxID=1892843 RepID=UPI00085C0FD8|nr:ferredoxin family protein [Cellulosilyticum sp. I15G10I2]
MSIYIDKNKCIACNKCSNICPGNLISTAHDHKAFIKCPQDCWGCTACLKECPVGAIKYFLGADIGGKGGYLYTENHPEHIDWHIISQDGKKNTIQTQKDESNKY